MASYTLLPDGITGAGGWTASAGTIATAIADGSDLTYDFVADADNAFEVTFANLPSVGQISITSVSSTYRVSMEAAWTGTIYQYVHLGASYTNSAPRVPSVEPTTTGYTDAMTKPGGGTYSISDVNTMTGGCTSAGGNAGETGRVTQLSWTVAAVLGRGTFALWAASLVGAAVGLSEMAGLSRAIYARDRVLLDADECVTMYRELREAKNTVYCY